MNKLTIWFYSIISRWLARTGRQGLLYIALREKVAGMSKSYSRRILEQKAGELAEQHGYKMDGHMKQLKKQIIKKV